MPFTSKTGEPVTEEKWQWVAILRDGSEFRQFDYKNEKYHYFQEAFDKSDSVVKWGLLNKDTGKAFVLEVPDGAKLIHFYENLIQHPQGGTAIHHRIYCVGYELGKTKRIFCVMPNDFVVEVDPQRIGVL